MAILSAGEGERRWFAGGGLHTWKVTEAASGGTCSAFEDAMVAGKSTPWHRHPDSDELTYLLEGECRVKVGDDEQVLGAGGSWFVPRGTPHAFTVLSATARVLAVQVPGTAARFYWDASEPVADRDTRDDAGVDFARVGAVAAATGATELLGAPPFG